MINVKLLPTLLVKIVFGGLHQLFALLYTINPNKITFASSRSEEISGNLKFVYEELVARNKGFSFVLLFKRNSASKLGKLTYLVHMTKVMYHLATSKYFVIDDYFFPVYIISPRKGIDIIQLWHAAGAFKTFGHSTIGKSYGPSKEYLKYIKVHGNYTKVLVSAEEVIPFYAEAFNMSTNKIYPIGIPRTDYFFDYEKHRTVYQRFTGEFPELSGKKLILYAPTFRGNGYDQKSMDYLIDFNALHSILGNYYAVLVHLHPYVQEKIVINPKHSCFIYQIEKNYSIEELLLLSDMLITDYSSIIFDYSILQRPILFYANDLEEYRKERDFYYPYNNFIPGPFFSNSEELAYWIKEGEFDYQLISTFRQRFLPTSDGHVSKKVTDFIFSVDTHSD
ncbi:CDP-glycerol glycerophosphotransferase family protein [Cytobacillus sp. IB215665]|uniref:CDP-glycerol glycerophosphotransferase family protein n=1 Tax=Cytobacillus sp. IB215665 TaxID=3097357 RepID=UPI002A1074EE|nr:CDP-glycerol glycerophosphotransferase family protein [Cytobacillus sp. IB215665]MDX8366165.1 CDP-glycerol glycerophosphotransferase family protein [Cytobacillus sp. IB215665]